MLDIVKQIPIEVLHDRADLTGNNKDNTFKNRIVYEGNPNDPRDFNYASCRVARFEEANKIAKYLIEEKDYKLEHWKDVCTGKSNLWKPMMAADVNNHLTQFKTAIN
jgi:hypothetical protein